MTFLQIKYVIPFLFVSNLGWCQSTYNRSNVVNGNNNKQYNKNYYLIPKKKLSKHERFVRDVFIKGILIPNRLISKDKYVLFKVGSIIFAYYINDLKKGVIMPCPFSCGADPLYDIKLLLKNNHLYISTILRYIQNEEIIGILKYNIWTLYKNNILDFSADEKHLEISDKEGNIVFSMALNANSISIRGYFINSKTASAISDEFIVPCQQKDNPLWKDNIIETVKSIKPYDSTLLYNK